MDLLTTIDKVTFRKGEKTQEHKIKFPQLSLQNISNDH